MAVRVPACPRCGYDLRGEIVRWGDECPVRGRCVECGLELEWRELLGEGVVPPRWYVEQPRPFRSFVGQSIATVWKALVRPWHLWSNVRMAHPVNGRRLAGFLLVWLSLALVPVSLATAIGVARPLLESRLVPLTDIARATLFLSLPGAAWHGRIVVARVDRDVATGVSRTLRPVVATAPPSARQSSAFLVTALMCEALLVVGILVVYVAMPVTRRRCKVRPRHLLRVASIGVASAVPLLLLPGLYATMTTIVMPGTTRLWSNIMRVVELVAIGACFVALLHPLLHWWVVTRWYLRMPHAGAVAFLAWVTGVMLVATVVLRIMT